MERYDGDVAPDPEAWLALDEDERRRLVLRHHHGRIERLHPKGYDRNVHAMVHVIVESQVAANEPPITRATVERLTADGLRRHLAIHMVAERLVLWMSRGEAFDPAAWERELRALDAAEWISGEMRRTLGTLA